MHDRKVPSSVVSSLDVTVQTDPLSLASRDAWLVLVDVVGLAEVELSTADIVEAGADVVGSGCVVTGAEVELSTEDVVEAGADVVGSGCVVTVDSILLSVVDSTVVAGARAFLCDSI